MPIKSYTCTHCKEKFERIILPRREYDESFLATCPECGGVASADEAPLVGWRDPKYGIQNG